MPEDLIDVEEAARRFDLHPETIRRLVRQGEIPAFKAGRQWRFSIGMLEHWIKSRSKASVDGAHVLVVDDEESIRRTVKRTLEAEGYAVRTAATAAEAKAALQVALPESVILDLRLPDASGVVVLGEIRRLSPTLPVIIFTGYPDSHLLQEALELSPFMVLIKPVPPAKLLETLALTLGRRALVPAAAGDS